MARALQRGRCAGLAFLNAFLSAFLGTFSVTQPLFPTVFPGDAAISGRCGGFAASPQAASSCPPRYEAHRELAQEWMEEARRLRQAR